MTKAIQDKLKEVQTNFDSIKEKAEELQKKINADNRQLSALKEELIRLQGEHRALDDLLPEKK